MKRLNKNTSEEENGDGWMVKNKKSKRERAQHVHTHTHVTWFHGSQDQLFGLVIECTKRLELLMHRVWQRKAARQLAF